MDGTYIFCEDYPGYLEILEIFRELYPTLKFTWKAKTRGRKFFPDILITKKIDMSLKVNLRKKCIWIEKYINPLNFVFFGYERKMLMNICYQITMSNFPDTNAEETEVLRNTVASPSIYTNIQIYFSLDKYQPYQTHTAPWSY